MNSFKDTNLLSVLVILFISKECYSTIINSVEGQSVHFNISYPCNSSKVTLRLKSGAPLYISNSPLQEGWLETEKDNLMVRDTRLDSICMIEVLLNPVMRIHRGTFVCFLYTDGGSPQKLISLIELNVDFPPGKASCELSNSDADQEWVSLTCTASVGSTSGYIKCFQNGTDMSAKTPLTESDKILKQTFLVRSMHPAFCCSSTFEQPKSMCECNDAQWNPLQNGQDIINTCPITLSTPSQSTTNDSVTPTSLIQPSMSTYKYWNKVMLAVSVVNFLALVGALLQLVNKKVRELKSE